MANLFGTAVNVAVGAKVMHMAKDMKPKKGGCRHGKKKRSR